jgi:hypothetical protein
MNEPIVSIIAREGLKDTTTGEAVAVGMVVDIGGYMYRTPSGTLELCAEKCTIVKKANKQL